MQWVIYGMVFLGAALMVYNIYGFVQYARYVRGREKWGKEISILNVPIFLLVMFLIGYLAVGIFGKPDLIVAGILFGGSVFVFIIYRLITKITKRIVESEELEAKLQAAEQGSKAKSSFLASISHEMRTPMNVILGLKSVAMNHPDLPADVQEQLNKIGQSGRHLLEMINNTLDLQSIEAGEKTVKYEEFSLHDVTGQIDAIAGTQCAEKGLTYTSSVQDEAQGKYLGDAMLLKQAILNLIDNAVKYTDVPGAVSFQVEQTAQKGDSRTLRFTVKDTGIGMSPDFLPKAFDLFSQEDTSFTNRYGGAGIGLTVAKQKVKLLGGAIAAASKQKQGSVFTITLPLKLSQKSDSADDDERVGAVSLNGKRILIVEDVPDNAEIAADLLELEGAESEHAENGQIALDMFSKSEPYYFDAILMDLRMPIMDGLDAARGIRRLNRADAKTVPIIAVTANAADSDVRNSLEAGMNAHLAKPIDVDLLYDTLRQWIWKSQTQKGGTSK